MRKYSIDLRLLVTEPIVLDAAPKLSPPSGSRAHGQGASSSRLHTPRSLSKTQKSSDFGMSDELRRKIQSVEEKSKRASQSGKELEIKSLEMTLKFLEVNKARRQQQVRT